MEDDASLKTSWTVSIMPSFPWLKTGSVVSVQDEQTDAIEVKLEEIRTCLDGNHKEQVDLWQLRQLSLSKGGLISHSIRKRAWPKLLGAHQQVLLHSSNTNSCDGCCSTTTNHSTLVVEITQHDMQLLEHDLSKPTAWNIEDHVWRNRLSEKQKQVTFLPGLTCISPTGSLVKVSDQEGTASPMTCNTPYSDVYASTVTTTSHTYTLLPRSAEEELTVRNIIIGVLREGKENENRNHYYRGLSDLTSVLLINLESPSLTCLMLKKLATYSLCAFDHDNPRELEHSIQVVSNALFQKVDSLLHRHFQDVIMWHDDDDVVSKTIATWIPTWFVSSLKDFKITSRILDVLMVSHCTMPIYLAVALTCRNRERLLAATDPATLQRVMRQLPRRLEREHDSMEALEQVIQTALEFIRLYPPHGLVPSPTSSHSISRMLMDSMPPYAMKSWAPTDWNLLQHAKALREKGNDGVSIIDGDAANTTCFNSSKYPLAVAAVGQAPKRSRWRRTGIALVVVVLVAVTAAAVSVSSTRSLESVIQRVFGPEPPIAKNKPIFSVPWKHSSPKIGKKKSTLKSMAASRSIPNSAARPPSRRAIVGSSRPLASKQAATTTASRRQSEKETPLVKLKQWRRNYLNKETLLRLATNAIVQGDQLRWKGQRFLI